MDAPYREGSSSWSLVSGLLPLVSCPVEFVGVGGWFDLWGYGIGFLCSVLGGS